MGRRSATKRIRKGEETMSTFDDEVHEVGKTVVITGAAKGIGRAFAEGFSRDGWTVVAGNVDDPGRFPDPTS